MGEFLPIVAGIAGAAVAVQWPHGHPRFTAVAAVGIVLGGIVTFVNAEPLYLAPVDGAIVALVALGLPRVAAWARITVHAAIARGRA